MPRKPQDDAHRAKRWQSSQPRQMTPKGDTETCNTVPIRRILVPIFFRGGAEYESRAQSKLRAVSELRKRQICIREGLVLLTH